MITDTICYMCIVRATQIAITSPWPHTQLLSVKLKRTSEKCNDWLDTIIRDYKTGEYERKIRTRLQSSVWYLKVEINILTKKCNTMLFINTFISQNKSCCINKYCYFFLSKLAIHIDNLISQIRVSTQAYTECTTFWWRIVWQAWLANETTITDC